MVNLIRKAGKFFNSNAATPAPYKVYRALLEQSGTSAPVATVLENTTGLTFTWTRDGAGGYMTDGATSTLFDDATKVWHIISRPNNINHQAFGTCDAGNENFFITTTNAGAGSDNVLFRTCIEIRIYP
jgi:hypothetical protein